MGVRLKDLSQIQTLVLKRQELRLRLRNVAAGTIKVTIHLDNTLVHGLVTASMRTLIHGELENLLKGVEDDLEGLGMDLADGSAKEGES